MKKTKLLATALAVCMIGLTSCGNKKIDSESSESKIEEVSSIESFNHVHTPGEVKFDENGHYTACAECGEAMTEVKEHTMCDISVKKATCTEDGEKTSVCSGCAYTTTTVIPAKGHTSGGYTQTEDGHYEKCSECKEKYHEGEHHYQKVSETYSTCVEAGEIVEKCTECGREKKTAKEMGRHIYVFRSSDDSNHQYLCSVCGTVASTTAHDYEVTENVEVTCLTDGKKVEKCSYCGHEKTTVTTASGHTTKTIDNGDGTHRVVCETCKETIVESIAHDNKEEVIVASGETTVGKKKLTCKECGHEETVKIPHTGEHNTPYWKYIDDTKHAVACTYEDCDYYYGEQSHSTGEYPISYPDGDTPGIMGQYCWVCRALLESKREEYTGTKIASANLTITLPAIGQVIGEALNAVSNTEGVITCTPSFKANNKSYNQNSKDVMTQEIIDGITCVNVNALFDYKNGHYAEFSKATYAPSTPVYVNGVATTKPTGAGSALTSSQGKLWSYTVTGDNLTALLNSIYGS